MSVFAARSISTPWRWLMVLLCGWGSSPSLFAQTVECSLDRNPIYPGESTIYRVAITNAQQPTVAMPEVQGCRIEERGQESASLRSFSGRGTHTITQSYRLTPVGVGTYEIPAPIVRDAGATLPAQTLELRVVPPEKQDLVIPVLSAVPSTLYPLTPFELRVRIFVHALPGGNEEIDPLRPLNDLPILEIPWLEEPLDGLESQDWNQWLAQYRARSPRSNASLFSINGLRVDGLFAFRSSLAAFHLRGKPATPEDVADVPELVGRAAEYWMYELRQTLVAQRSGTFEFPPVTVKGTFADTVMRGQDLQARSIYTTSAPLTMTSKSPPEQGRPDTYQGALGVFEVAASAVPTSLRVGDPLTLRWGRPNSSV